MENFEFYSPTYFVFGKETENRTGEFVKKYGGHKVLIHYGGGSVVRSGLLDRVKASLDAAGIAHVELGGVKGSLFVVSFLPYLRHIFKYVFELLPFMQNCRKIH